MVKMPRFVTSCLETGIKTLVTETGQQLPPSIVSKVSTLMDIIYHIADFQKNILIVLTAHNTVMF